MLIRALYDYYDVMGKKGVIKPAGFSEVGVRYLISLTESGKIDDIIDWQEKQEIHDKKGKIKETSVPHTILLPKRTEKTAIESNIIEHRPLYIFGLALENEAFVVTDKSRKSHLSFCEKNKAFVEEIHTPIVNAYRLFLEAWEPEKETDNPLLHKIIKNYDKSGFAFCLSGHPEKRLHEDESVLAAWKDLFRNMEQPSNSEVSVCSVSGEIGEIARIHNKIRGFSAMGSVLVNYNSTAEESYGKTQSYNSSISEVAMKKYTEALNYLLSSDIHRTVIGDVTVVHWAASGDDRCDDILSFLGFSDRMDEEKTDDALKKLLAMLRAGTVSKEARDEFVGNINAETDYYIVGLKPNSSRLAVKFIYRHKFGEVFDNVINHVTDMRIRPDARPASVKDIMKETVSPNSSSPVFDPAGMEKLMYAVINGTPYPYFILSKIIERIKHDSDTEQNKFVKFNDIRIGILKAYLNRKRKSEGKEEYIKMALDKENNSPAYLCGRLFALCETIQQKASGYSLNRTIRDTYISSAAARPATAFPQILKLNVYHMAKLGNPKYFKDDICEITGRLGSSFPKTLSLSEQGEFFIGYYQQLNSKNNHNESEEK